MRWRVRRTGWAYSRPYFPSIGGPSSLDSDTWPVFGQDKDAPHPLRPTPIPSRGTPGWKFLPPKKFTSTASPRPRARHARPDVMCPPGRLARKFLPRGTRTTRFSRTPGSPGSAPRLKRHPAPSNPGVHSARGDESDEWHDTKAGEPTPHDIVQPGKLGWNAAPWPGVWGELRAFTWPRNACRRRI